MCSFKTFELGFYIQYILVKALFFLSRLFPKKVLYGTSHYLVSRRYSKKTHRKCTILKNLTYAFPEKSNGDIRRLLDKYIEHSALQLCELLLMLTDRFDYERSIENLDAILDQITKLNSRADRGILFILGHYGNWELAGQFLARNGMVLTLIGKAIKNRYINERILIPFRTREGNISIERQGAMITLAKAMIRGGVSGLLIDQMIPPPNGVEVDFFGQKAYATKSIAQLKLKFDPLVMPLFPVRVACGKFRLDLGEEVAYVAAETEEKDEKIVKMTQHYTEILEEKIRETPEQWQWSYTRWRQP